MVVQLELNGEQLSITLDTTEANLLYSIVEVFTRLNEDKATEAERNFANTLYKELHYYILNK